MRLPRDIGGEELAGRLSRYGYSVTRQTGSHMRLTSKQTGRNTTSPFLITNRCAWVR